MITANSQKGFIQVLVLIALAIIGYVLITGNGKDWLSSVGVNIGNNASSPSAQPASSITDDRNLIREVVKKDCESNSGYHLGLQDTAIQTRSNLGFVSGASCFPSGVSAGDGYVVFLKKGSNMWSIVKKISGPIPTVTASENKELLNAGYPKEWMDLLNVD